MKLPNLIQMDPWLEPFKNVIKHRIQKKTTKLEQLAGSNNLKLVDFANGYLSFGCFRDHDQIVIREWLPNASEVFLLGDFSGWKSVEPYRFSSLANGVWEIRLPRQQLKHKDIYKLKVIWPGGEGERIPAWCRRVVQDNHTNAFNAQVWLPEKTYQWKNKNPKQKKAALIYEAHIGMAGEAEKVSSFSEFRINVLPRIAKLGYNTIQLMAIQEHPYYGSFGYHVSSFFAVSSRFGTPEELKELIDEAHGMGLMIIMDIVHSHAVRNEVEGLGKYDGTRYQFFHEGPKGEHPAWDSYCFDYGKNQVIHFLLSNLKYWLEEFRFDGFRFDGVTSMLYLDHGLGRDFTSYEFYFDGGQDEDALVYLMLANQLIHEINPNAISIAEDMSGYPGLATSLEDGGLGFDYRLAMGIPDFWIKLLKEHKDEDWNVGQIYHELTSKRVDEKVISYTESHDQALVGDKTIAFRLMDKEMYYHMEVSDNNLVIDRGLALHKMIRFITSATAGGGYLNFMGNEFGHPEWIDFPRQGNNWSFKYALRQWSLVDREDLKYQFLNQFDQEMIRLIQQKNLPEIFPFHVQKSNQPDQVIAFSRSDLIFIFNFNPTKSFTDYGIPVPEGKYKYLMSTDELRFGGFGRIDETQRFQSILINPDGKSYQIKVYIPARTAIVLEKLPVPGVYNRLKEQSL